MNEEDRNDGDETFVRVVHDIYEDNKMVENRQVQSTVGITSGIDSEPPQVGVFMEYDVHTVYWE